MGSLLLRSRPALSTHFSALPPTLSTESGPAWAAYTPTRLSVLSVAVDCLDWQVPDRKLLRILHITPEYGDTCLGSALPGSLQMSFISSQDIFKIRKAICPLIKVTSSNAAFYFGLLSASFFCLNFTENLAKRVSIDCLPQTHNVLCVGCECKG